MNIDDYKMSVPWEEVEDNSSIRSVSELAKDLIHFIGLEWAKSVSLLFDYPGSLEEWSKAIESFLIEVNNMNFITLPILEIKKISRNIAIVSYPPIEFREKLKGPAH